MTAEEKRTQHDQFFFIQMKEEQKHTPGPGKYYYNYRRKSREAYTKTSVFFITQKKEAKKLTSYQCFFFNSEDRRKETHTTRPVFIFYSEKR
jgi:hypothetical protein